MLLNFVDIRDELVQYFDSESQTEENQAVDQRAYRTNCTC
jgi:hypothetical protein